jgi:hypothetical protein
MAHLIQENVTISGTQTAFGNNFKAKGSYLKVGKSSLKRFQEGFSKCFKRNYQKLLKANYLHNKALQFKHHWRSITKY